MQQDDSNATSVVARPTTEQAGGERVLVVDDEPYITDLLHSWLSFLGFEVRTAATGTEALVLAAEFRPQLLVLDVMLPDIDGFELCRQIRQGGERAGVVFLTARNGRDDTIAGLTVGGDDYISKPFSLDEVVARMRAVLRRTTPPAEAPEPAATGVFRFVDLELDEERHEVRRANTPIDLSPTEFAVLRYLLRNAGRVVSKRQIVTHVWEYDFDGDPRIVESYISSLRKKVDHIQPPLIHTLRGVGYSLRLDGRANPEGHR
ncbi:MAG: two-component system, OmpR family, response regulator [Pseudonocardiales bacterium]|jgi:two-component system OmpR family response regulator|nr:two-component system, OmpR family, response regulator [Pseudonocardiales bacterium]